jgi:hypothetical protein
MSATEAERLGVSADDAKLLVRIDDAKLNIAPPAEETIWFRLVGVDIGNPNQDYPRGDNVQTVERWHPPDAFDDLPKSKIAEILAELRQGPSPGEFYLTHANANGDWAGWPIAKLTDKAKGEAKRILHTWINNDVLIESKYESLRRHKTVTRVTVNEAKAVEMLGHLWTPP